jgi:iron complex transport system permease protein
VSGAVDALRLRLAERPGAGAGPLAGALALALAVAATLGAAAVPFGELAGAFTDPAHPAHSILWAVRLPRLAAAAVVGCALALSGTLLQTLVRNPLADPGLLGVNAGAGVAALAAIVLWPEHAARVPPIAFIGALVAIGTVLLATGLGAWTVDPLRVVLCGVAVQSLGFAAIAVLTFLFADRAPSFVAFTVGSLNGVGWREVAIAAAPTALGSAVAFSWRRPLDLLLLDDDSAASVGLAVRRARLATAALAALLAAGAVSIAGLVGFVGLVVPNAVRLLVGPGHRALLPLSALSGALLVVVADTFARTLLAPLELPVGALLAAIGGPYLLWLVTRRLA